MNTQQILEGPLSKSVTTPQQSTSSLESVETPNLTPNFLSFTEPDTQTSSPIEFESKTQITDQEQSTVPEERVHDNSSSDLKSKSIISPFHILVPATAENVIDPASLIRSPHSYMDPSAYHTQNSGGSFTSGSSLESSFLTSGSSVSPPSATLSGSKYHSTTSPSSSNQFPSSSPGETGESRDFLYFTYYAGYPNFFLTLKHYLKTKFPLSQLLPTNPLVRFDNPFRTVCAFYPDKPPLRIPIPIIFGSDPSALRKIYFDAFPNLKLNDSDISTVVFRPFLARKNNGLPKTFFLLFADFENILQQNVNNDNTEILEKSSGLLEPLTSDPIELEEEKGSHVDSSNHITLLEKDQTRLDVIPNIQSDSDSVPSSTNKSVSLPPENSGKSKQSYTPLYNAVASALFSDNDDDVGINIYGPAIVFAGGGSRTDQIFWTVDTLLALTHMTKVNSKRPTSEKSSGRTSSHPSRHKHRFNQHEMKQKYIGHHHHQHSVSSSSSGSTSSPDRERVHSHYPTPMHPNNPLPNAPQLSQQPVYISYPQNPPINIQHIHGQPILSQGQQYPQQFAYYSMPVSSNQGYSFPQINNPVNQSPQIISSNTYPFVYSLGGQPSLIGSHQVIQSPSPPPRVSSPQHVQPQPRYVYQPSTVPNPVQITGVQPRDPRFIYIGNQMSYTNVPQQNPTNIHSQDVTVPHSNIMPGQQQVPKNRRSKGKKFPNNTERG